MTAASRLKYFCVVCFKVYAYGSLEDKGYCPKCRSWLNLGPDPNDPEAVKRYNDNTAASNLGSK